MSSRSFRFRVVYGSLLWTVGLLAIAIVIASIIIHHNPGASRITHSGLLIATAIALMVAGITQLRRGLSPFIDVRARLADVRDGRAQRVTGRYPTELQPLVDELNALLERREQTVARAIAKAGDLAHGLKTPLAVLTHEAERARRDGHGELALAFDQQIDRMRRQIDYHLAHARAASGATAGVKCAVLDSAEGLVRTLQRLHADRALTISISVEPDHAVRARREDVEEMLGNVLDNACKWAKSAVTISSAIAGDSIAITVNDDGPGIDPALRAAVLQRGVRADEAAPGSGFGLAIVRDLAELYGGSIALSDSALGGLKATLTLPRS